MNAMNAFKIFKTGELYYYFDEEDYDPSYRPKNNKAEFVLYRITGKDFSNYYFEIITRFGPEHHDANTMSRDSYMVRYSKPWTQKYLKDDYHDIIGYLFEEIRPTGHIDFRRRK